MPPHARAHADANTSWLDILSHGVEDVCTIAVRTKPSHIHLCQHALQQYSRFCKACRTLFLFVPSLLLEARYGVALADWVVNMRILDPSSPVDSQGTEVMLFGNTREQLPTVRRGGDIIRLHRLKAPCLLRFVFSFFLFSHTSLPFCPADHARPPPARLSDRCFCLRVDPGLWGCNASRV